MAEELKDREDEIQELFEVIKDGLKKVKRLKGRDKATKIEYVRDRIARANAAFESYKVDLRLGKKDKDSEYRERKATFERTINELTAELEWAEKQDLTDGKAPGHPDNMTTQEILDKGSSIQHEDKEILTGVIRTVDSTKTVAADTLASLGDQRDQLVEIDKTVQQVEGNLKMAEKQLRQFAMKIATDKIIMGFLALIFLGVVGVIIYSIVGPDKDMDLERFLPANFTR